MTQFKVGDLVTPNDERQATWGTCRVTGFDDPFVNVKTMDGIPGGFYPESLELVEPCCGDPGDCNEGCGDTPFDEPAGISAEQSKEIVVRAKGYTIYLDELEAYQLFHALDKVLG